TPAQQAHDNAPHRMPRMPFCFVAFQTFSMIESPRANEVRDSESGDPLARAMDHAAAYARTSAATASAIEPRTRSGLAPVGMCWRSHVSFAITIAGGKSAAATAAT